MNPHQLARLQRLLVLGFLTMLGFAVLSIVQEIIRLFVP
jgi:hypothetical protein